MPKNYTAQLIQLSKKVANAAQKLAKSTELLESGGRRWKEFFASNHLDKISVEAFALRSDVLDMLHTIEYVRGGDTPKTAELNRVINNLTADFVDEVNRPGLDTPDGALTNRQYEKAISEVGTDPVNIMQWMDTTFGKDRGSSDEEFLDHITQYLHSRKHNAASDVEELEDFIDKKPDDAAMEEALVEERKPARPKNNKLDKLLLLLDPNYQEYLNEGRHKRPSENLFNE